MAPPRFSLLECMRQSNKKTEGQKDKLTNTMSSFDPGRYRDILEKFSSRFSSILAQLFETLSISANI